jgi:hypothetical protein
VSEKRKRIIENIGFACTVGLMLLWLLEVATS